MAQIFMREDVMKLLNNKQMYFIGDSNIRAIYKDVLQLIVENDLISPESLKSKQEECFKGDRLYGKTEITNGRHYREERIFEIDNSDFKFCARFYFITVCYGDYVEEIFQKMETVKPDVIVYNSCVWDISRWGPKSIQKFVEVFPKFVEKLKKCISPKCYFVWLTTPLLSKEISGGFLLHELDFLKQGIKYQVIEANQFASKLMSEAGFDVLDGQYYLRFHTNRREIDGIHWESVILRYLTCLLLTKISMAWRVPLPGNPLNKTKALKILENEDMQGPPPPIIEPCFQLEIPNNGDFQIDEIFQQSQLSASCERFGPVDPVINNQFINYERFGSAVPPNFDSVINNNTQMNAHFKSNECFFSPNIEDPLMNNFQAIVPPGNCLNRRILLPTPPNCSQIPSSNFANFEINVNNNLARTAYFFPNNASSNYFPPQQMSDNPFSVHRNVDTRKPAKKLRKFKKGKGRFRPF